jgi:hypothetical protein
VPQRTSLASAQIGSAIGPVASFDDLAHAIRVRASSTLRSNDESPRPSIRGFIEEASRLFSDALTLEFDEPSKFVRSYALIERLRLLLPLKSVNRAAFQRRPPVNVMR